MQNSVSPGYKPTLPGALFAGKRLLSTLFILFFMAGVAPEVKALPPGVPDLNHPLTRLTVTNDYSRANNGDKIIIEAHVVDSDGNPVDGTTVYFNVMPGNVTVPVTTGGSFGSGNARLELASDEVGSLDVGAKIGGISFQNSVSIHFIAYLPDAATSRVETVDDGAIADNVSTNTVRAVVRDADGNPVANQDVIFQITSGSGSFIGPTTVTTDANGEAIISLTSASPGTVTITATVTGTPDILINDAENVRFVLNTPSITAATTRLERIIDGVLANGAATDRVRAVITDDGGNPVPNATVVFQLINNGINASFTTPFTVITDAMGIATVSLVSSVVGTVDVTATVNGTPLINGNPLLMRFVPTPPDVNEPTTALIIDHTNAVADGSQTNIIRAHITDANGNPVQAQTVVFTVNSGTAITSSLTVFTDVNGDAVLTLTSTVAGQVNVSATINGIALINGNPAIVTFVAGAVDINAPTTRIEVVNNFATADDVALNTVRVVVTDANGNPLAGQTINFAIASGTAVFVGSAELTTDAFGAITINLQSTVAGTVDITAAVNGVPIVNGSPAQIIFVAGPPDLTHLQTGIIIDKNNADADGIDQNVARVHIVDAFGNAVAGQTITFNYNGVATSAGALTFTTDANGDAVLQLTSTTIGQVDVTATMNNLPIPNGSPAVLQFTTYPDIQNTLTRISVVTDNAFADGTTTNSVRVHVVDNFGNGMAGASVTFTIASGNAVIMTPQPVVTDANGDAIILLTSTTVGYVTITAVADGRAITNGSPARVKFTAQDIWVPRIFTPNGDGNNDVLRPIVNGNFRLHYFNVYNRWGNLVFTTNNINQGWDGRFKGVMQPNETYVWILVGIDPNNQRIQKRGMLSLVR